MRLISTNKVVNFKNWIKQHDSKTKWDFNNPDILREQFVNVIRESGDIDIKTIFHVMFSDDVSGLSISQDDKVIKNEY